MTRDNNATLRDAIQSLADAPSGALEAAVAALTPNQRWRLRMELFNGLLDRDLDQMWKLVLEEVERIKTEECPDRRGDVRGIPVDEDLWPSGAACAHECSARCNLPPPRLGG